MDAIKNLFTPRALARSTGLAAVSTTTAGGPGGAGGSPGSLQSRFRAQTARLRDIQRAQRPKNTQLAYGPKQREWRDWCARLAGNIDGAWVTEDKLCLFLEQEVINRESRAPGYQARKARRRAIWEDGERARKRRKTAESAEEDEKDEKNEKEKENGIEEEEKILSASLFNETVRYSVVNSYVSAITELYAWQSEGGEQPSPPLRGAKLSAMLENVRRGEEQNRRVNFTDRGLFTITGGYDVKGLRRAISWCWTTASEAPGLVESYLRTTAEHLLGYATVTRGESRREA